MQINTQQLRQALHAAAGNVDSGQKQRASDAKVANLELKNVYISRKGEVHVSKSGFNRLWADLMGRKTGENALKQAMVGLRISEKVAAKALNNILENQKAHQQWSSGLSAFRNQQEGPLKGDYIKSRIEQHKANEPSLSFQKAFEDAASSELSAADGTKRAPDPVKTARGQGTIAAQLSGAYHADIFNAKVDEKLKNSGLVGSDEAKLKGKLKFNPRDTAQNSSNPLYSSIQEGIAKEVLQNGLKVMEGGNLTEVAKNKALEYAGAAIDKEINNFKNHSRGVPPMKSIPEASEKAENKPDLPTLTKDQISSFTKGFVGAMPGGPSQPVVDK